MRFRRIIQKLPFPTSSMVGNIPEEQAATNTLNGGRPLNMSDWDIMKGCRTFESCPLFNPRGPILIRQSDPTCQISQEIKRQI